jgi:hypothetical protein
MCADKRPAGTFAFAGDYESSFELAGFCENGWVRTKLRGLG